MKLLSMHERLRRAAMYLRDTKGQAEREKHAEVLIQYIRYLEYDNHEQNKELLHYIGCGDEDFIEALTVGESR